MATVERGNVVLTVEDDNDIIQHYLDLGYNLVDGHGNVLKKAIPHEVGVLQQYYLEHTQRIAELEAEVAKLKAKKTAAKKTAE